MTKRIFNFAAGPCTLPLPALEKAQEEFVDYQGTGMSLIEMSHRGKQYDEVHQTALKLMRELLSIPDTHDVLFLQGGATLQFAMVPMNLMVDGKAAEYVNTGAWAKKAIADAKLLGATKVIWTGEADKFMRMPRTDELKPGADAAYLHLTTNETIGGVEFHELLDTGEVPLVCDMSSHFMSRPVPWDRVDVAYAGAQKNLGPAGNVVVVIRKDLMERAKANVPAYLKYATHAKEASLYNTPPVFAIYMMKLMLDWVKSIGGLAEIERRAIARSSLVYDVIDASGGWYNGPAEKASRSRMNVVFRLPTEDLEKKFLAEAGAAQMSGLKGHRSVGGCRASMYNAMPIAGAEHLAQFMRDFQKKNS